MCPFGFHPIFIGETAELSDMPSVERARSPSSKGKSLHNLQTGYERQTSALQNIEKEAIRIKGSRLATNMWRLTCGDCGSQFLSER